MNDMNLPAGQSVAVELLVAVSAAVEQYLPAGQGAHDLTPPAVEATVPMGHISAPRVTTLPPPTVKLLEQAWMLAMSG
jgi:hypothetical protein